MNRALWVIQGLLALLFLFTGGSKQFVTAESLAAQNSVPLLLYRFVGVTEILGAFGLILPGLLHIRPGLTPLAVTGLTFITISATVITIANGQSLLALPPLIVALLCAFVAYRRWRPAEQRDADRHTTLQTRD